MRISFAERFRRQCRAVGASERALLLNLILDLEEILASPHEHRGAGLRKLHPLGIWELRVGLSLRALFRLAADQAVFQFLGTHDEVQRFLKSL